MFAQFTFRKINSAASRLGSWVSNSNTLNKPGAKGNKQSSYKTYRLGKIALPKLPRGKCVLLAVLLLSSSAAALTSFGIRRAMLSGNAAAFVSQSVPATMIAGETYAVTVRMLNQGTTTWTPGQAYRLGSQNPQDNTTWGLGRVNLLPGDSVSMGATTTFSFVVTAPSSPGSYNFQWQMVQDGVEWFGAKAPNMAVQVVPRPALTKLKEYVYAGGRLITSEEKSCVPTLSPTSATLSKDGGTGSFNVSNQSGCNWTASTSGGWMTITSGATGVGNGTVSYSAALNSGAQRSGTITVNGQAFTITQAPNPASCAYSLSKSSESLSEQASSGSVALTTGAGCPWNASSNAGWLTITSPASGSGSATINYSVTTNNSGAQRTGAITVGGKTLTITQIPNQASCSFALNPSSWLYGIGGGGGSFSVTTGAGCFWDAANANGWITITGGATGTGNGAVSFTVHANNGGWRTGGISVRGQVFTVTQCGYELTPGYAYYGPYGGVGGVTVSSMAACSWSAFTNDWDWIHITSGASGSGNGSVNYSVDSYNQYNGYRSGTIMVTGQTAVIEQFGPVCSLSCEYPYRLDETICECVCEYCENLVGELKPAPDAQPRGLTARYFGNTTLSGQPVFNRTDPVVNFNWAANSPDKALPADGFSARWSGQLAAPSNEAYTFYLYSDGGARLWVNNQLVIDRWQNPSEPQTSSAPVELKAGEKADVRVEYYKAEGKATIHLLWSSASTPKQIIPRRQFYPEAATNKSAPTDTNKQTGMLLPPGSDPGPKAALPQPSATSQWLVSPLVRAGLVLLIACGALALLLRTGWRQARRQFTMAAVCPAVLSRLRDQIASRFGELFRIAATVSDKLKFVVASGRRLLVGAIDKLRFADFGKKLLAGTSGKLNAAGFGKRLLAGASAKLKFIGHFLAVFRPAFKVVSHCVAVVRLGGQKLEGLLPERMRATARQALSFLRSFGLGQLKPALRRAIVIALVVTLATPISPAQADGLGRAAQAIWQAMSAYKSAAANQYSAGSDSELINRSIEMPLGKGAGKVFSVAPQTGQVEELQVCPRQLVMFAGERYTLTPVALDGSQKVVHGVGMSWSSLNAAVAEVSSFGQVAAMTVGTTVVEVQCGGVSKQIPVEVRSGTRPTGSNQEADIDPTGDCSEEQASMFAPRSAAGASAQQNLLDDIGVLLDWDPMPLANSRAAHFRNVVGSPRFSARSRSSAAVPTRTQLGSHSYQFNVPVTSVGGRGAGADIGMTLNSRVWNNDDGSLTFNYVGAYPAPGWSMGYGKIIRNFNATAAGDKSGVGIGNNPGDYLLVSGDGTRVRLAAKYDTATSLWFNEPDDGSFWRFDPRSGEMRYPDGSRMIYSSVNGCLLPTAMINTNGGAITMTYRDYCEGACVRVFRHRTALSALRDTLGRYVTFHYYGDGDYTANAAAGRPEGELAAIKAPDMDGVQQEVIRVEYQPIILKYDFGGIAVNAPVNNSQIQVVRRVHYPQTGRGFLFLDYSSYGMPRKISTRMGMKGAGGTITDGVEIAYTTYNYTTIDPSDPYGRNQVGSLDDFPQFTRREEWWLGKTDANGAPTTASTKYDYSRTTDGATEVTTMRYVDKNCEEVTTTGTDSGQLSFGKVISVERKDSTTGAVLSKQIFTYMTAPDGEVEIEKIEKFDEAGQGTLVSFGYSRYGRVIDKYEHGYKQAGVYQVRRRIQYDYVDDPSYVAARFLGLVSGVSVYDAAGGLKAKTQTTYDDYAAMGGMQSYGLNPSVYPPNHDTAYDQSKVMRGNPTAVRTFSNIASGEATTLGVRYDIFGNVVEGDLSCCVKKFFNFSGLTAYSQPDWVRLGGDTGLSLQTTYQHNYFTGLVENETSPDGQQTIYEYDGALRPWKATLPTGAMAVTEFEHDGAGNTLLAYIRQTIYDDQGERKVITGKQWFDGSGRAVRTGTGTGDAPDSYDVTATVYDGWGRVVKQSNPYLGDENGNPQAGALFWTTNTYDLLSRVIQVTLPDSQFTRTEYRGATATSGATTIVTDTVGRKRKTELDGFGRLVKVTEQNPANGNLEWEANYSHDALDNLIQTDQGGQLRTFTYDAKSRLKSEIIPEAGMTTYEYDFDNIQTRTDARGVVTTYTYGELNLPTGVSYNTASAPGVAATAPMSVAYRTASPGKGLIETVTDGGGSERYSYDSFGRLQSRTRVIDGVNYETRYEYNSAGQMTLMIYPSGKRVKVEHDARGRLSAMQRVGESNTVQETYLSGINYRADGLVSAQNLGDGTTESFEYSNERLQLTSQKALKGGATLLNLSYGYQVGEGKMGIGSTSGNSGQLASVTGTIDGQNRDQTFTYDNVGRLATATGWGWERRFGYDRYGNQTGVWDAVSGGNPLQNTVIAQSGGMTTNRIASVNGTTFNYDANGNVTGDGGSVYTYDAKNRIVSVNAIMVGLSSESYGYDAGNRRVKKVVGGVVTHYIWEGNQVIAEYERGGGSTEATGARYYHRDRLSTRFITDGAGAVVGKTDHLPFGEELGGSGEREKHKFTTYERDATGLDYAINRHYSATQGRFVQVDPIRMSSVNPLNPQTLNLYAYVGNDPINKDDPSGKCPTCPDNVYGKLADAAYTANETDRVESVVGWTAVKVFESTGLDGSGYRGVLFQGAFNGHTEYIYATAGTDSLVDAWEDAVQLIGISFQYKETVKIAGDLANDYPGVSFTGHSLGAGLGAANAYKVQGKAVTFNGAGLSPLTKVALGLNGRTANITAYITRGDPLNKYQPFGADGNQIYIGNESQGHRMADVMQAFDEFWAQRQRNGDFNDLKIGNDFVEVLGNDNTCVECVRMLDDNGNVIDEGGGGGGGGGGDDWWWWWWYLEEEYLED